MDKFKVTNVRVGQAGSAPFSPIIIAEVELQSEGGEMIFFSNAEVEGMPDIYKTTTSKFADLMNMENTDLEKQEDVLKSDLIYSSENYDGVFDMQDSITPFDGIRYLMYITQSSWEDTNAFIEKTKGKFLDEIEIPNIEL